MAGPDQCTSVSEAINDTVLMGIKLVGDVGKNIDEHIANALKSDAVRSEIRKTLDEIARANVRSMPLTFSGRDAKKLATALAERSFNAVRQEVFSSAQKSAQYLRLKAKAENVVNALKCSPTGVWLDKNKSVIYILAAGVIVSGAVGMYIARAGDEVTEPLSGLLKDKKFSMKPIGTLELSAGLAKFEPSKREFKVEVGATADIKQVKIAMVVTGQAIDGDVQIASARGRLMIPFGKVVTRYEISYDPDDTKTAPVQLGLGIEFGKGQVKFDLAGHLYFRDSRPAGGSVAAGIKGTHGNIPFSARVEGRSDSLYGNALMGTYTLFWDSPK